MTRLRRGCAALICALVLLCALPGRGATLPFDEELPRETRARNLNLLAGGTIVAWGAINWDYFQRSPHALREGWFEHDTTEGGSDKLGHLYSTYVLGDAFSALYRHWGYADPSARGYGALSALGATGLMELGDSFSNYGFSSEDMLMNCAGAAVGYLRASSPAWAQRIDLRAEYDPVPEGHQADIFTDYERLKYLVAVKASGFETLRATPLRYLELHFGYYARNYDGYRPDLPDRRERDLYVAVGLNVGALLEGVRGRVLFDYLQLPYTYLHADRTLGK